jgi:hypothetical protein
MAGRALSAISFALINDKLEAARTGNWFLENNLVIARLDELSRNEDVQAKPTVPDAGWDLVVWTCLSNTSYYSRIGPKFYLHPKRPRRSNQRGFLEEEQKD